MNEHILIIGGGSIGERHLRNFLRHEGVRCSLAEPDAARRDQVQREYALVADHADWETADLNDVDGVVICTPTNMHVPMLDRLADTGVPVLCEKPLAMTLDGVTELGERLQERGTCAGVAFCWRHNPLLEELRQRIEDGDLGQTSLVLGLVTQFWPEMRSPWPPQYAMRRETGGGVIQDHIVHWINLLEWFFGSTISVAAHQRHLQLQDVPTEDFGNVTLRFADGRVAVLTTCMFQRNKQAWLEVVGSDATARFDLSEQGLQIFRGATHAWERGNARNIDHDDLFCRQAGHFLQCIRGEATPRCTFDDAVQTLRTVLAAVQSSDCSGGFIETDG